MSTFPMDLEVPIPEHIAKPAKDARDALERAKADVAKYEERAHLEHEREGYYRNGYRDGYEAAAEAIPSRRIITTPEELDSLPYETVIRHMAEHGYVWEQRGTWHAITRSSIEAVDAPKLPVLVLFDPRETSFQ